MADLIVELYGHRIGRLLGPTPTFDFAIEPAAFDHFALDSSVLSVAIPLVPIQNRSRKGRRQTFFAELLPEGDMLTALAQASNVDRFDTVGLLGRYGRDVAGAIQIWDPQAPGEPKTPGIVPVNDSGVAELLNNVLSNPLGNWPLTGKSSLAGVQDKIVLARVDDTWNRVVDGYPSTHILKPAPKRALSAIFDEEYGSRFARAAGLADFETTIRWFDGTPALVIERYDRDSAAPQGRIHQEDFNQALGARGNQKYQRVGGQVQLARIAEVFTRVGDDESARRLLTLVTISVAVGNLDLHAKNVSILHRADGGMALAPAYDVVPQLHYPNIDGEVALAIAGELRHAALTKRHIVEEGASWGLRGADAIVDHALEVAREVADREAPLDGSYARLQEDIARVTTNLIEGREAGAGGRVEIGAAGVRPVRGQDLGSV